MCTPMGDHPAFLPAGLSHTHHPGKPAVDLDPEATIVSLDGQQRVISAPRSSGGCLKMRSCCTSGLCPIAARASPRASQLCAWPLSSNACSGCGARTISSPPRTVAGTSWRTRLAMCGAHASLCLGGSLGRCPARPACRVSKCRSNVLAGKAGHPGMLTTKASDPHIATCLNLASGARAGNITVPALLMLTRGKCARGCKGRRTSVRSGDEASSKERVAAKEMSKNPETRPSRHGGETLNSKRFWVQGLGF